MIQPQSENVNNGVNRNEYNLVSRWFDMSCLAMCVDLDLPCLLKLGLHSLSVLLLYDFGSQANIIRVSVCPQAVLRSLEPSEMTVKGISETRLPILGIANLQFSLGPNTFSAKFFVVADEVFPFPYMDGILSRNTMKTERLFLRGDNDKVEHLGALYPLHRISEYKAVKGQSKRVRFDENVYFYDDNLPDHTTLKSDASSSLKVNKKLINARSLQNNDRVQSSVDNNLKGPKGVPVRLSSPTKVPPESTFAIQLRTSAKDGEYMFSPKDITVHGVSSVASLCTVKDGLCNLALVNESVSSQLVVKGTQIGSIIPLTEPNLDCLFLESEPPDLNEVLDVFTTTTSNIEEEDNPQLPRVNRILNQVNLNHLPKRYRKQFQSLLEEFADIMFLNGDKLTCCNFPPFHLDTQDHAPIVCRPYSVPQQLRPELQEVLHELQEQGVIKPSDSYWANPCFVMKKPGPDKKPGRLQLVCDLRNLNAISVKPIYRFPIIQDLLQQAGKHKFYTVVDFSRAYFQCPVTPETSEKLSFVTEFGNYSFQRIPYGLSQAPFHFTKCLDEVLRKAGIIDSSFPFLDDILSPSDSYEEGLEKLRKLFLCFRSANLKISPSKLKIMQNEVDYLGFSVSHKGIRPLESKVAVILQYPRPETLKQVRRFTAMLGFYAKHMKNLSVILGPLYDLTRKNKEFKWTDECENSFLRSKELLASRTLLGFIDLDPNNPPLVYCDASDHAVGISLNQWQNGKIVPLAFNSKRFSLPQLKWSTYRKELEGVIWALKIFKNYLLFRPFNLYTDHRPLTYIHASKNLTPVLQRHLEFLSEFDFKLFHVKGKHNSVVDALSRILVNEATIENLPDQPFPKTTLSYEEFCQNLQPDSAQKAMKLFCHSAVLHQNPKSPDKISPNPTYFWHYPITQYISLEDLKLEQRNDPRWKKIITNINQGHIFEKYYLRADGILIFNPKEAIHKICMPRKLLPSFLTQFHNSIRGHLGVRKTYFTLNTFIHSSSLLPEIHKMVKACHICNSYKPNLKPIVNPGTNPVGKHFFHTVHMDIAGPYYSLNSQYKYFISFICTFSKFTIFIPLKSTTSNEIISKFLKYVLPIFLTPKLLISDNASNFISAELETFFRAFNIDHRTVTPYLPSANGSAERSIQSIKSLVATSLASNPSVPWHLHLPLVQIALNNSVSTVTGYTPNYIVFGRHLRMPGEILFEHTYSDDLSDGTITARQWQTIWESVQKNLTNAIGKREEKMIPKRNLTKGQIVYLKDERFRTATSRFFNPKFQGPYEVLIIKNNNVVIRHKSTNEVRLTHISKLKLISDPEIPTHTYNLRPRK